MWADSLTLEYVNLYYVGCLNKVRIFIYYSYTRMDGVIMLALFTKHQFSSRHYSSWYYSLKILFIVALSLIILTLFTIFILSIPTLFILHTSVNFVLISYVSSYEGKTMWRPMLDAIYRIEHNHATE